MPLKSWEKTLSPGRAGLLASEAGSQGCGSLLVGGGACQEPQEEQAHPPQPKRHAGKGKSFISLPFQSVCVQQPSSSSFCFFDVWFPLVNLCTENTSPTKSLLFLFLFLIMSLPIFPQTAPQVKCESVPNVKLLFVLMSSVISFLVLDVEI